MRTKIYNNCFYLIIMLKNSIFKLFSKFLLVLLLFFLSLSQGFSNECYFDQVLDDCNRFSTPFITINLNFNPIDNLSNYSVGIFNKDNPSNKFDLDIEDNIVRNLVPFDESGVYVLNVVGRSKSGELNDYREEFIVDLDQPLPPFVSMNLNSENIIGTTEFPNQKVGLILNGEDLGIQVSNEEKEFQFNVDLSSGVNFVQFYTMNSNGLISNKIGRVVYNGEIPIEDRSLNIDSVSLNSNLDSLNDLTIKNEDGSYSTFKRDFFIGGELEANDGALVFINGVKSIVKSNSFGAIIDLNEGWNNIVIEDLSGEIKGSLRIEYLPSNFQFLTINMDKIINGNQDGGSIRIEGEVNLDLPFNLYVNGEFKSRIIPSNNEFSYTIDGLTRTKNHIYLEGLNHQNYFNIVYLDREEPRAELVVPNNLTNIVDLTFKIEDDIGIDYNSVLIRVGDLSFSGDDLVINGNYYSIPLNEIESGEYSYSLNYADRSGKSGEELTGVININSSNTVINRFDLGEFGSRIGDNLYLNSGSISINLKPSKFIAFKSIYLDGLRQNSYEIFSNGDVELDLNLTKESGVIEFEFIDNSYRVYTEKFYYYTDLEKPRVELDYIRNPNGKVGSYVKIYGKIIDSNFNWESLKFNGQNSFLKFGDYFEANVPLSSGLQNLEITGYDISYNLIENSIFGSFLFGDDTITDLDLSEISNSFIEGSILNNDESRNMNRVMKYSAQNTFGLNIGNNFKLPISEREGLFSAYIQGYEDSGNRFKSFDKVKLDGIKPEVYYVRTDNGNKIIIDGTLSDIQSLLVLKGGIPIDYSYCLERTSLFSTCIESDLFDSGSILVSGMDSGGNSFDEIVDENNLKNIEEVINFDDSIPRIYLNGNDEYTFESNYFIQGNIVSNSIIRSVKVNGLDCDFDDISFICFVDLNDGLNEFTIEVENDGGRVQEEWNITKLVPNIELSLDSLTGDGIYKIGDDYYITSTSGVISGNVNDLILVKLLIDNNYYLTIGEESSEFTANIDLSNQISNKESDEFDIMLGAEDEYGNEYFSESIHVIYNRVVKTLVSIFVE